MRGSQLDVLLRSTFEGSKNRSVGSAAGGFVGKSVGIGTGDSEACHRLSGAALLAALVGVIGGWRSRVGGGVTLGEEARRQTARLGLPVRRSCVAFCAGLRGPRHTACETLAHPVLVVDRITHAPDAGAQLALWISTETFYHQRRRWQLAMRNSGTVALKGALASLLMPAIDQPLHLGTLGRPLRGVNLKNIHEIKLQQCIVDVGVGGRKVRTSTLLGYSVVSSRVSWYFCVRSSASAGDRPSHMAMRHAATVPALPCPPQQ